MMLGIFEPFSLIQSENSSSSSSSSCTLTFAFQVEKTTTLILNSPLSYFNEAIVKTKVGSTSNEFKGLLCTVLRSKNKNKTQSPKPVYTGFWDPLALHYHLHLRKSRVAYILQLSSY